MRIDFIKTCIRLAIHEYDTGWVNFDNAMEGVSFLQVIKDYGGKHNFTDHEINLALVTMPKRIRVKVNRIVHYNNNPPPSAAKSVARKDS